LFGAHGSSAFRSRAELPAQSLEMRLYSRKWCGLEAIQNSAESFRVVSTQGCICRASVPYMGADIPLEAAFEFLKEGKLELHIIGDGPQKAALETMVDQMGVRGKVYFHGWVPHDEVHDRLRVCDFMALPSIREFGGGVAVEAMALGVTPIVADYAGPSELVDEKSGIRVGFHDKKSLIGGIKQAIGDMIRSPETLHKLGAAARKKVQEKLIWDAKANQIMAIYDAVFAGKKSLNFLDYRN